MPRHTAFLCLRGDRPKPLEAVDRTAAERGLDARDTALARKIVGIEVRRRATLRAIVAGFTHKKPKAELALLLRLGVLQLLYLDRVPPHAAVSETVRATSDFLGLSKGNVVNGVLRSVQRALREGRSGDPTVDLPDRDLHFDGPVFRDPAEHPHLWAEDALSIPSALHKKWTQRVGAEEAERLARLFLEEAPLSLRTVGGQDRDGARAELEAIGVAARDGRDPRVLLVPSASAADALASEAFQGGRLTAQGEHALRATDLAGPVEGRSVLDVCAAPGGKGAALAQRGPARLALVDLSARRIGRAFDTWARLGLGAPALAAMDSVSAIADEARFDVVFVDAPCSNTGVLSQRPGARWRYGPRSQSELVALQGRLLREAAQRVAPGGALVYSTCSLEPEENEQQVARFLGDAPGWREEEHLRSAPGSIEDGGPVDGGFAARLRHEPR